MWKIWTTWKTMSIPQRVVTLVHIAACILTLAFAVVQVLGIWDKAINIFIPLLGVMNMCQAYLYWNEDRKVAVFSLVAAVFILICAAAVFLL